MRSARMRPIKAPLYDPRHDHDACGVGFVADGRPTAVAMCFLPTAPSRRAAARAAVADVLADVGLTTAGWRDVPVRPELVAGRRVAETPDVWQAVITRDPRLSSLAFKRRPG